MADYFEEMGWRPTDDGDAAGLIHLARLLFELVHNNGSSLEEWPSLPPPASKSSVAQLNKSTVTSDGQQCPVCLKNHQIGDVITVMPCQHKFHSECIVTWLEKTNSCPLCRLELPTDDASYEEYKKEQKRAQQREKDIEELHNSMFL